MIARIALALILCLCAIPAAAQERHPLIRTVNWAFNRCAAYGDISSRCVQRVLRDEYVSVGQWMSDNRNSDMVTATMEMCRDHLRYIDLMDNARCARAVVECARSTMNTSGNTACVERRFAVDLPEDVVIPPGN